jgi:hypothetical protein
LTDAAFTPRPFLGDFEPEASSANALDTSAITAYDIGMDNQRNAGDHEAKPRVKIVPKSMAQAWADYCALDHAPKQEFNPARTAPMPQDRDRGDRGDRGR